MNTGRTITIAGHAFPVLADAETHPDYKPRVGDVIAGSGSIMTVPHDYSSTLVEWQGPHAVIAWGPLGPPPAERRPTTKRIGPWLVTGVEWQEGDTAEYIAVGGAMYWISLGSRTTNKNQYVQDDNFQAMWVGYDKGDE